MSTHDSVCNLSRSSGSIDTHKSSASSSSCSSDALLPDSSLPPAPSSSSSDDEMSPGFTNCTTRLLGPSRPPAPACTSPASSASRSSLSRYLAYSSVVMMGLSPPLEPFSTPLPEPSWMLKLTLPRLATPLGTSPSASSTCGTHRVIRKHPEVKWLEKRQQMIQQTSAPGKEGR